MQHFRFDIEGRLVETDESAVACNVSFPSLDFAMPTLTIDLLEQIHESANKLTGIPETLLMNPDMFNEVRNWPWDRTGQGLDQTILQQQRVMNVVQNSILDSIRIVTDKYCPLTVRRQFRFPRSKKKRIRKKWTKDQRNWKDVRIAFRWIDPGSFFKVTYPDRREYLQVRSGLEKRNGIIYGDV